MFGLGAGEVILILLFALIFIGPKKLPELAKGLGKGIREFQKAKDDLMTEVKSSTVDQLTECDTKIDPDIPRVPDEELHAGETPLDANLIKPQEDHLEDDIALANAEMDNENDSQGHEDYHEEKFAEEGKVLEQTDGQTNQKKTKQDS
jgi:sec-independent protein translocase protein TatA